MYCSIHFFLFFFFNDTATTEIYTLSLHDALPISLQRAFFRVSSNAKIFGGSISPQPRNTGILPFASPGDRKSTRLNSSHVAISYAVFCLKKKKKSKKHTQQPR